MISIIIPIYHAEAYLARCLDSLLAQSCQDFEIICAGSALDCDKDEATFTIAEEYKSRFPQKIRVLRQPEGHSSGGARNTGLDAARGNYIMYVDSDDYVDKFMLEKMVTCIKNSQSDIVFCAFDRIEEGTGKILGRDMTANNGVFDINSETIHNFSFYHVSPWAKLYTRELLQSHMFPAENSSYCDDYIFFLSLIPHIKRYACLPDLLYHYIIRQGSVITTLAQISAHQNFCKHLAEMHHEYQELRLPAPYYDMLTYSSFIHAGIASPFHLINCGHLKDVIAISRKLLDTEFPDWRRIPLLPNKHFRLSSLLVWISVQAYKVNLFTPLLFCYAWINRHFCVTGKW